jgi:arylsulfatase
MPEGPRQLRLEFTYDGGGIGKGGRYALFVDGTQAGEAAIKQTA